MSKEIELAESLQGKLVRFNHEPESSKGRMIVGMKPDGMVQIDDIPGDFAPDLFLVIPTTPTG